MIGGALIHKCVQIEAIFQHAAAGLALACLFVSAQTLMGQADAPTAGLPIRAPGYELYYHNDNETNAFATRWGYYDGWRDGRHDRDLGRPIAPTEQDRYKLAPDHGDHPGISRTTYKGLYRTAYLHGYEQGSKR